MPLLATGAISCQQGQGERNRPAGGEPETIGSVQGATGNTQTRGIDVSRFRVQDPGSVKGEPTLVETDQTDPSNATVVLGSSVAETEDSSELSVLMLVEFNEAGSPEDDVPRVLLPEDVRKEKNNGRWQIVIGARSIAMLKSAYLIVDKVPEAVGYAPFFAKIGFFYFGNVQDDFGLHYSSNEAGTWNESRLGPILGADIVSDVSASAGFDGTVKAAVTYNVNPASSTPTSGKVKMIARRNAEWADIGNVLPVSAGLGINLAAYAEDLVQARDHGFLMTFETPISQGSAGETPKSIAQWIKTDSAAESAANQSVYTGGNSGQLQIDAFYQSGRAHVVWFNQSTSKYFASAGEGPSTTFAQIALPDRIGNTDCDGLIGNPRSANYLNANASTLSAKGIFGSLFRCSAAAGDTSWGAYEGSQWVTEVAPIAGSVNARAIVSVAVDSKNQPHIVYSELVRQDSQNQKNYHNLYYLFRKGPGEWAEKELLVADYIEFTGDAAKKLVARIIIDRLDAVHVIYSDYARNTIEHLTNTSVGQFNRATSGNTDLSVNVQKMSDIFLIP